MKKPVLVVMAAGMGSRYGGLKQIDPVGAHGQLIIDYSIFDARRAGFETVIFIIKKDIEADFKEAIGDRLSKIMDVKYAYQELEDLPQGFAVPQGRTKPWGTSHAVFAARNLIDGPFAVINADDYYGPQAFQDIYTYLCNHADAEKYSYCMAGYLLKNTVTESGSVARGVCNANPNGTLANVTERTHIEIKGDTIQYTEDGGASWNQLPQDAVVSMNLWGFTQSFVTETGLRFAAYLKENLAGNPLKCEYFLPFVVSKLIEEEKASVKILPSPDKWYGVTYKQDKDTVVKAIAQKTAEGLYPDNLWQAV
ncbi:MAG: sugar phosphate nucleotidyltransferase [Oscillospiraceae bacterium]|nr:sugar phosphate nucleotidyltransferase [Oscillospiraceae bacterium]